MFISPSLTGRPAIPSEDTALSVTHTSSETQYLNENQEILTLALIDISILRHVFHLNFPTFRQNEQKCLGVPEILQVTVSHVLHYSIHYTTCGSCCSKYPQFILASLQQRLPLRRSTIFSCRTSSRLRMSRLLCGSQVV